MKTQNQIKRTLSQPEAIEQINNMLDTNNNINRSKLADLICDQFNFFNPCGEKQRSGCLKALRKLEQDGFFVLPVPCKTGSAKKNPRRLEESVPDPQGVPNDVGKICELKLVSVETEEYMRIWNELMIQDHPRGAGPLVGRQLRYLILSEHGWLGGISFSSAALHLEDRDKWIGWDWNMRQKNLHHVVNMSRFLIRSSIVCKNLASCVLGLAIKKFPIDFEIRYGHRPLLVESFVDTSHYKGTCYRAANWQWIGRTKGRGRQDLLKKYEETVKDIYVYPLDKDFRVKIGLSANSGLDALNLYSSIANENWAENEFGGASLGDKRLTDRLVEIAENKAMNPGCTYSGVTGGNWPKVKAYYRLIDKPDDSAVTMSNILLPHREQTIRRMKAENIVLCIQDGSDLNYNNLDQCEGLGVIGSNQTGAISRGLHMHSTIAVTTKGLPLGILRSECTAPKLKSKDDKRSASSIPIEEKKTFCWIEGVRDCMDLKVRMPRTSLINVMDREGDFFELFDDQRENCYSVNLLVRAKHNRGITGEHKLFETARQAPAQARIEIKIPRQSARAKKSKQKARAKRPMRIAKVSVRYLQVKLNPPPYHNDKEPIAIWVVHVREDNQPVNTDRLEWFLLTTINIKSIDDALNCVKWYCLRWRIEDWHRVLKSGCKVEKLAHKTAERQRRAVAINMVIAWRIMLMT
ncbi:MAG: IS4 family transposase, partial [Deltaproteobacteria bacterium]|nr:IS4 family transposase [Deltaproteobacteria bacterium]